MSKDVLASKGFGNNKLMNDCVNFSVARADKEFHYEKTEKYILDLSQTSKNRLSIKNLQGYCDQDLVTFNGNDGKGFKMNRYWAPYHGRGEYYLYLPYLLGIALQFDKGYMINKLVLRNDKDIYKQINFDMLIRLSGIYENEKGKTISRKEYSYLILGIALHLVEDLWAHVAVINDSEKALNAYAECFDVNELGELKTLLRNKKPICYLNMYDFCRKGKKIVNGEEKSYYGITHSGLAEGTGEGSKQRRIYAQNAAGRLLGYYKNGYIMHSGNQKLGGTDQANQTDRNRLRVSKCAKGTLNPITITLKNGGKVTYGQYICNTCESGKADGCYQIYYSDKKKGMGLGYMFLPRGNAQ